MAMTCLDVELRLTEFRRRQLPDPERREVASHLLGCGACREAQAADQRLAELLQKTSRSRRPAAWRAAACFLALFYWFFAANHLFAPLSLPSLAKTPAEIGLKDYSADADPLADPS